MRKLISIIITLLIFTVGCGGSSSDEATVEVTGAAIGALFGSPAVSESLNLSKLNLRNLETSQEMCNNLGGGPANVLMFASGGTGEYGAIGDTFSVVPSDYCEDLDHVTNEGPASDTGPLFAAFSFIDDVTGDCDGSTLTMTRGSGIARNIDGPITEIYGQFEIGSQIALCTLRLENGEIDMTTSSCTDRGGTAVPLISGTTCTIDPAHERLALPTTIEGHFAVSTDEGSDVAYDCQKQYPLGGDTDGFTSITQDCTTFNAYGFNLQSYNVGLVATGDATSGWEIYTTTDLGALAQKIKIMHQAGYPVLASIDFLYQANYDPNDPDALSDGDNFDAGLLDSEEFKEDMVELITEIADVMETLDVEILCPISEVDRVFTGATDVYAETEFTQGVMNELIANHFTGAYMYISQYYNSTDTAYYDFTDFDYAALNSSPVPGQDAMEFQDYVAAQMDNLDTLATNAGIPFLISNAGIWGGALEDPSYDWDADAARVLDAFEIMTEESDRTGTAGIIYWEGANGEIVIENYSAVADFIATEFGGDAALVP